jgi:hypothetical protein
MNHDEAIRWLSILKKGSGQLGGQVNPKFYQALDYAIAYMEPKPTQFDERVADVLYFVETEIMPPWGRRISDLINDQQAHIQKLEKGQSDGITNTI